MKLSSRNDLLDICVVVSLAQNAFLTVRFTASLKKALESAIYRLKVIKTVRMLSSFINLHTSSSIPLPFLRPRPLSHHCVDIFLLRSAIVLGSALSNRCAAWKNICQIWCAVVNDRTCYCHSMDIGISWLCRLWSLSLAILPFFISSNLRAKPLLRI